MIPDSVVATAVEIAAPFTPRPAPGIMNSIPATLRVRVGNINRKFPTTLTTFVMILQMSGERVSPELLIRLAQYMKVMVKG